MLTVRVEGGTGAGKRIVKEQVKSHWHCPDCEKQNAYFWLNCQNCGHPRNSN